MGDHFLCIQTRKQQEIFKCLWWVCNWGCMPGFAWRERRRNKLIGSYLRPFRQGWAKWRDDWDWCQLNIPSSPASDSCLMRWFVAKKPAAEAGSSKGETIRPRQQRRDDVVGVSADVTAGNTQTRDCWSMRFADQRTDQIPLLIHSKWRHRQDDDHQNTNEEGKQVIFPYFLSLSHLLGLWEARTTHLMALGLAFLPQGYLI